MAEYNLQCVDALVFQQDASCTPKGGIAQDVLIFNQTATCNIKVVKAENKLPFSSSVKLNTVLNKSILQRLSFHSEWAKVKEFAVYQNLIFDDEAIVPVHQILTFNQVADFTVSKGAFQTLIFNQVATVKIVRLRVVTQTIAFNSNATVYVDNPIFIGQPISNPPISFQGMHFSLGTLFLDLPAPEFDNSDKVELTRVDRKSRGGDLIIFRDEMWPKNETLLMRWEKLKSYELDNLLRFIDYTLGNIVDITDYEGRVYQGIISKPSGDGRQLTRERYGASIEVTVIL